MGVPATTVLAPEDADVAGALGGTNPVEWAAGFTPGVAPTVLGTGDNPGVTVLAPVTAVPETTTPGVTAPGGGWLVRLRLTRCNGSTVCALPRT